MKSTKKTNKQEFLLKLARRFRGEMLKYQVFDFICIFRDIEHLLMFEENMSEEAINVVERMINNAVYHAARYNKKELIVTSSIKFIKEEELCEDNIKYLCNILNEHFSGVKMFDENFHKLMQSYVITSAYSIVEYDTLNNNKN